MVAPSSPTCLLSSLLSHGAEAAEAAEATEYTQLAPRGRNAGPLQLQTLWLERNYIGDQGVCSLAAMLAQNTVLTSLRLDFNRCGKTGAIALAQSLYTNTAMTDLRLSHNCIGCEGMIAFGRMLICTADASTNNAGSGLQRLDLSEANTSDYGITALAAGLRLNRTVLRVSVSAQVHGVLVDMLTPLPRQLSIN